MSLLDSDRVVVVGGTGFLGSHLVRRMIAEGKQVLTIARRAPRFEEGCSFQPCDVLERERLVGIIREFRPKVVFHLAAHPDGAESIEQMHSSLLHNTIGVVNSLEAASLSGSVVFVMADSCKVYGNGGVPYTASQPADPICSYAVAKAAAWQLCRIMSRQSCLNVVGTRFTFIYGPRQGWNLIRYICKCVREGRPVRLQGGNQTRDLLYVDDAVDALLAAAGSTAAYGHSIPIGGGTEIPVTGLCRNVLEALGANAEIIPNAEEPRVTEIWRSAADNSDAMRLLNWAPRTSLAEGLARTVSWEVSQAHGPRIATPAACAPIGDELPRHPPGFGGED